MLREATLKKWWGDGGVEKEKYFIPNIFHDIQKMFQKFRKISETFRKINAIIYGNMLDDFT